MENTIGDRIKEKRKELGLTQLELANKIGVTDRAVSKREQNEGNPDISILPILAKIFNVSLDYLMTGKDSEEKIITISKIELCAKKDDPALLKTFNISGVDEDKKGLRDYIKQYDSTKVFDYLLENKTINQIFYTNNGRYSRSYDIQHIIYFLIVTNNLEALKQFGFRDIGFADPNELNDKVIKTLITDKRVKESTKKYILTSHKRELFDINGKIIRQANRQINGNAQIIYPYLLSKAIELKEWQFADLVLDAIIDANSYIEDYKDTKNNIREAFLFKPTDEINYYQTTDSHGNKIKYFYVIEIKYNLLVKLLKAHKYHLLDKANKICKRLGLDYIDTRTIELEILENSTMSEDEKLRFKAVNNGIVVPSVLIESKNLHFVKETIDNNYYHYYEYVYDCLVNKKIDKLYKFFIDNNLERQANDLLDGPSKYPKILEDCWGIFNSSSRDETNEKVKILKKYQNDISSIKNGRRLKSTDISNLDDNEIIKDIKFLKIQIFTDTFNKIQKEKQIDLDKLEREKFVNAFTRKSFEDLLINNDRENFIIRLCMLLDAILKYDYKCAGNDFYTRLNNFINLKDIDNENSVFKDNVECKNIGNLLNRLRVTRNNIVHFDCTKVKSLSDEELRQCLDFTFSIIKRGI